jgi:hypothetical protein
MNDQDIGSSVYVRLSDPADSESRAQDASPNVSKAPIKRALLALVMLGLVILGPTNYILYKIMYNAYGDKGSYFASQGINLLYLVYGGVVLYPRMLCTNKITPRMRAFPQWKMAVMGVLDSFGTFFSAMGAVSTPGQYQLLLNQTLIPLTMLASRTFIGSRYGCKELLAASLIIAGALVTVLPGVAASNDASSGTGGSQTKWYAVLIYFLSNVPMACSAVYKELKFAEANLDVWYLTQWVSFWQLLVGFLFAPALTLPGFASADGIPWTEIKSNFADGARCFLETTDECAAGHAFWLLTGYCLINVLYNTLGLYLVKEGSAVLNGLSYSLVLPFSTLAFSLPFLGTNRESLRATTFVGLVTVMAGFMLYQHATRSFEEPSTALDSNEHREADGHAAVSDATMDVSGATFGASTPFEDLEEADAFHARPRTRTASSGGQCSFQERVIGMGYAHRPPRKPRQPRRKNSDAGTSFAQHFHY